MAPDPCSTNDFAVARLQAVAVVVVRFDLLVFPQAALAERRITGVLEAGDVLESDGAFESGGTESLVESGATESLGAPVCESSPPTGSCWQARSAQTINADLPSA